MCSLRYQCLVLKACLFLSFTIMSVFFTLGCKGNTKEQSFNNEVSDAHSNSGGMQDESGKGCVQLKFLDEYIYPANKNYKGTKIGGLSGIDCAFDESNDTYYIVSDDFNAPRFYKAEICIEKKKIKSVSFKDVVYFDKQKGYFSSHFLDLESLIYHNGNVIISSEGSMRRNRRPVIFTSDLQGNFVSEYEIPEHYLSKSRHNGVFESLTRSVDGKGFWCVNELPLKSDGTDAQYSVTHSPLRFAYYDYKTKKATKEFIYELSPLPLPRQSKNDMIGVSDVLEYEKNKFLVIERAFQGRNVVRIYAAEIEEKSTNALNIENLKSASYVPMKKTLIFDFDDVKHKLAHHKIDNIEGISFGKTLENGNRTMILISDDNFQRFGKQLTQFILMELVC